MKILVTSANIGGVCNNTCIEQTDHDVTFICHDDSNFSPRKKSFHPRMTGKIPKMLAWELYPGYDCYIWIDASFSFTHKNCVSWFVEQMGDKQACFFKHPSRDNVFDEMSFCVVNMELGNSYLLSRYEGERMKEQVKYYLDNGLAGKRLFAAGAFIYSAELVKNTLINPMKEWFYQNCLYSLQDQLSLPYVLQKFDVKYNVINQNIYSCKYLL